MGSVELKSNIHKMVDGIQNEQLLQTLYDFLKIRATSQPGNLWSSLTKEQRKEVLLAFDESEDEKNLINRDEIFNNS